MQHELKNGDEIHLVYRKAEPEESEFNFSCSDKLFS